LKCLSGLGSASHLIERSERLVARKNHIPWQSTN